MALYFNNVKTIIPGVGERAYIWAGYMNVNGSCTPNPYNTSFQCVYLSGYGSPHDTWAVGQPLNGIFPNVGDWVTLFSTQASGSIYYQCYKVLEIVDEATFNTGNCVSCYNNGYGGDCSDAFITVPPYPGDPNGCRYNNTINGAGLPVGVFTMNTTTVTISWISSDCVACTTGTPPVFEPNMIVACCDPTETYQLSPGVLDPITGTTAGQLGVTNFTQAFGADLYLGGASTGQKCWHLKEDYPPFGPFVVSPIWASTLAYPDCASLNTYLGLGQSWALSCCPTPPTYEWCCMTGIAGPAGPTTCSQVAVGSCVVGQANVSAGPFLTQQLCVDSGCATVVVVDDCELPAAKLNMLQGKISKFTDWKNKSLGR